MIDHGGTYLAKAQESVTGARSELLAGRFNNSANRSYYAIFQAAIHAILAARIRPPNTSGEWNHGWVQGQFNSEIISRRHLYPTDLRGVMNQNYLVRVQADYAPEAVTQIVASRALRRAERFVGTIVQREARP